MSLFQYGPITLHSGEKSLWKMECDALTIEDWLCIANMIGNRILFGGVEGVPQGGLILERELIPYATPGQGLLIVDDVFTTGASMEKQRAGRNAKGVVVFARAPTPDWITAIWNFGLE